MAYVQSFHAGLEFDLVYSQPGIGSEFVKFVQSGWESTQINVWSGK